MPILFVFGANHKHQKLTVARKIIASLTVHSERSLIVSGCNYIILDGIERCMRIYCTRHDDIHRRGEYHND